MTFRSSSPSSIRFGIVWCEVRRAMVRAVPVIPGVTARAWKLGAPALGSGLAGENGVTQAADLPGQGQTGSGVPRLLGLRVPEEPIAEIPTDDAHALEAK